MSTLSFRFHEGHDVRVVMIEESPWFVASDVCTVLDYRDAFNAVRILDADEKGTHNVSTLGGDQRVTIINESGLYALVLRSRKPEARQFRKWVTAEVLPAIRKTGRYEVQAAPAPRKMRAPTEFLSLPFVDVNSPYRFWCLPLEGDYFAGYEKGRTMALAYLAFLSANTSRKPDSSYIGLILESFMKRFQFINGAAFVDAPIDHGPLDFYILKGHYCGFFGTLGHAAWLTARSSAINQLH
ncbi:Bro-N domain-containing protein [Cupriavidus sp. DL-D2]|uniref:BRO-N domain-containing protein n=1 Tax=Cupriavidus sp. DL-D2 TaxID=3144974 RepID=UPI0032149808